MNAVPVVHSVDKDERISQLEEQVAGLREEVRELKAMFEGFRKQFE